jgi:hypothetical protein
VTPEEIRLDELRRAERDRKMAPILDRIPEHWGKSISVREEWDEILLELDAEIAKLYPYYIVHQVKEKFRDLRYYTNVDHDERVNDLIVRAEKRARGVG